MSFEVQYVSVEGSYCGTLYISNKYIMFDSNCEKANPDYVFALHVSYLLCSFIFVQLEEQLQKKCKIWHFQDLEDLFKRRFLLLNQGCEIYSCEKKMYFFNFFFEEKCDQFFRKISEIQKQQGYRFNLFTEPKVDFRNAKHKNVSFQSLSVSRL